MIIESLLKKSSNLSELVASSKNVNHFENLLNGSHFSEYFQCNTLYWIELWHEILFGCTNLRNLLPNVLQLKVSPIL